MSSRTAESICSVHYPSQHCYIIGNDSSKADNWCRMTEMGNVAQLCTYARIDTTEVPFTGDLMDAWEDPASFFLLSSMLQPSILGYTYA